MDSKMVNTPIVSVRDLVKTYAGRGTSFKKSKSQVQAVAGISFDVHQGETLSIVGESGCGKSTTARCVTRILKPTSGSIELFGTEVSRASQEEIRPLRRQFQMVFQDPYASLNANMTVEEIISEPLIVHGFPKSEIRDRVMIVVQQMHLHQSDLSRFPHQFSGGQRQRIGIARAVVMQPKFVVLDEPVSALDVSIQADIIQMLEGLQESLGLAFLMIAHDLSVVRHVSDRVAVMYLGKIVEIGTNEQIYEKSSHPYTQALLAAAPIPDPRVERNRQRIILKGDVPSPANPPSGCRFRTRCWKAEEICSQIEPLLTESSSGHQVACHFPEEVNLITKRRA
jgi:peptide/nickel transport system ATP-binding protein/oligopeptide transport system ATP-binding protein